jgi:hypothetical protein
MSLTRDDWVKLLVPLIGGVVILAPLGQFFIREWYQPYIRYVTGSAYMSTNLAIYSVGLKNEGHADAENVTVKAAFPGSLVDISTGETGTPFDLSAGGKGENAVIGSIKRLVPGEITTIYFITQPSLRWSAQVDFIRGITFNGGQGKTGTPWLPWVLWVLLPLVVFAVVAWVSIQYTQRWQQCKDDTQVCEAIQMGLSAAQEGGSEEQPRARVEEWYETIPFFRKPSSPRKESLITFAQAAFTGARRKFFERQDHLPEDPP